MKRRHSRRQPVLFLGVFLLLAVVPQAAVAQAPLTQHKPSDPNNSLVAKHGFFMLGTEQLFLYHSVQFKVPAHAFQMIMTATLEESAMNTYRADVAAHAGDGSVWLLHNHEKFALSSLRAGSTFQTNVKRLKPDRDYAKPFLVPELVTVTIDQVLYFRPLNPGNSYMQPPASPYILFGNGVEKFLAHRLAWWQDYDVLEAVHAPGTPTVPFDWHIDLITGHSDIGPLPTSSPLIPHWYYGSHGLRVDSIYWFDTQGINAPANPPPPPLCGHGGDPCETDADCCSNQCLKPGSPHHTDPFPGTCIGG